MASPSSGDDLFNLAQVSASVSKNDSLRFLEEHGFFYQGDMKVGKLVDELYSTGRARSKDAKLAYFKSTLRQDSRVSAILDHYPIELPRFRFPWGTTPEGYYNWDIKSSPMAESGLIVYLLGSGSEWVCRDGSLELDEDGNSVENGTLQIPDHLLENYPKRHISMEKGGILLVRPRAVQQATAGRSIMLGLMRRKGDNTEGG